MRAGARNGEFAESCRQQYRDAEFTRSAFEFREIEDLRQKYSTDEQKYSGGNILSSAEAYRNDNK